LFVIACSVLKALGVFPLFSAMKNGGEALLLFPSGSGLGLRHDCSSFHEFC
jgi:hypothetical protein